MPLLRIEVEQLAHDRFHVEFEGAGSSANRKAHNALSFDAAMEWIIEEYASRAKTPAVPQISPPLLEPSNWVKPIPKGRREVAQMRMASDAQADKSDPTLQARRIDIAARDFRGNQR